MTAIRPLLAGCAIAVLASAALAQSPANIDAHPSIWSEHDEPTYDLAARTGRAENFDPLVDLATPNDLGTAPHAPDAALAYSAESPWAHLGLYGNTFYWMFGGPSYFPPVPPPPRPAWAKGGLYQRLTTTITWLSPNGDDGMGVWDLELKPLLGVPIPSYAWPTLLTPGLGLHALDGPTTTDVPSTVYDMYLDIRWLRQITPGVGIELGLTPGWYGDFEQSSGDAFRVGGRVVGAFTCSPMVQVIAGLAYLDRFDVSLIPVGGVIWTPHCDARYELLIPRPKAAWRLDHGCPGGRWVYVAGEFGGGMWAIQRASGLNDELAYRDYRLVLGIERTTCDGVYSRLEVGYVFGRELEYDSGGPEEELDPALMMRAKVAF